MSHKGRYSPHTTVGQDVKASNETKPEPWSLKELQIGNAKSGKLGSYILGFGQDDAGEPYVLTTDVLGDIHSWLEVRRG